MLVVMSLLPVERLPRYALLATLVAFAALSLCYCFATPLKRGPDEPAHFIYIRSLATSFAPPEIAHSETHDESYTSSHEGHQPPLYYALLAVPFALLSRLGASNETIWRAMRLLSIPIGVVWIYTVYRLAKEFFDKESYATATAAFTTLLPTSAYMAGVISNDCLISLFFTLALIPTLSYFKSGMRTTRSAIIAGAAVGLAVLTKAQGLVLLPTFALVSLLVWRRRGYADCWDALRNLLIVFGIAAAVGGWWLARSWMLYGSLMPHSLYRPLLANGTAMLLADPLSALIIIGTITLMLNLHFWIPFWLVRAYVSWSLCVGVTCALDGVALIGLGLRLRRKDDLDRRSLALLLGVAGVLYILYLHYVLMVDKGAMEQGRLFLPAAGIAGIVFVIGYNECLRKPLAKKVGAIVGAVVMILLNIIIAWCGYAYYARGGA